MSILFPKWSVRRKKRRTAVTEQTGQERMNLPPQKAKASWDEKKKKETRKAFDRMAVAAL